MSLDLFAQMEGISYTNMWREDRITEEVLQSPPAIPESEFLVLPVFLLSLKCFTAIVHISVSVMAQTNSLLLFIGTLFYVLMSLITNHWLQTVSATTSKETLCKTERVALPELEVT